MSEKILTRIGWFASFMAVIMYFSYVDQIRLNIAGQAGSIILPIATIINCSAWVAYGSLRAKKEWPIIVANAPGVILGIITAITAVIH